MRNFLKVIVFGLLVIGAYTLFSTAFIPSFTPEKPPPEVSPEAGPRTREELVSLGEEVYKGKGACTLCHNIGGRAPLLERAAAIAPERLGDPRYRGRAQTSEGYLFESLLDPSAYVVPGFGVPGTGDTVSPMPDARSRELGLNDTEIKAVVAYLERLAGVPVTVKPGE